MCERERESLSKKLAIVVDVCVSAVLKEEKKLFQLTAHNAIPSTDNFWILHAMFAILDDPQFI